MLHKKILGMITALGLALVTAAAVAVSPTAPYAAAAPAAQAGVQRAGSFSSTANFDFNGPAEDFLAAAALQPSDLPGALTAAQSGYLTADDATALAGGGVAQTLADNGFLTAYDQIFTTSNIGSVFGGGPAVAGAVITLFDSGTGAATWNGIEAQSAGTVAQGIASAAGAGLSIDSMTPISIPSLGDSSSAIELQGSGTISGIGVTAYADIAFIQRGPVQYTVFVAGLQGQRGALAATAQALDNRVVAALTLLPSGTTAE